MKEIRKQTESLPVELTTEEIKSMQGELVDNIQQLHEMEEDQFNNSTCRRYPPQIVIVPRPNGYEEITHDREEHSPEG